MPLPPKLARNVPMENERKLIPVRASRVEVVDGDDPNAIGIIVDSEIALYRFRLELLKAVQVSSDIFNKVAVRVVHREIETRT